VVSAKGYLTTAQIVQILASPDGEPQILIVRRRDDAYVFVPTVVAYGLSDGQGLGTARSICGDL
jgi:hypothetical protein